MYFSSKYFIKSFTKNYNKMNMKERWTNNCFLEDLKFKKKIILFLNGFLCLENAIIHLRVQGWGLQPLPYPLVPLSTPSCPPKQIIFIIENIFKFIFLIIPKHHQEVRTFVYRSPQSFQTVYLEIFNTKCWRQDDFSKSFIWY